MDETGLVKITEDIAFKFGKNPGKILDVPLESREDAERLKSYLGNYQIVNEGLDGGSYVLQLKKRSQNA